MKNMIFSLAATTALTLAAQAYAADESASTTTSVEHKKDGGYETTVKSKETTEAGTSITSKTKDDVDMDSNGKASRTIKSSSTVDPEGLGNKKTHTGKLKYEEKDNGGSSKTVTSKDTDAAGTNTYTKEKKDVDVDANGNVTTTVTKDQVTDPKGMMNKTETTSKTKMVNGVVTEESKETK